MTWIDSENFGILESFKKGQISLEQFGVKSEHKEFKVAFNDLTADQKKKLVDIEADFKLYVQSGRVNPVLKDRVIKEKLFEKEDIIKLIKAITGSKDRDKVMGMVMESSIPPVIINQWLFQAALKGGNIETWDTVVLMESYTDNLEAYACLAAGKEMLGAKFCFPKKLRE